MFTEKEIQHSKEWILSIYDLRKTFDQWAENNLKDLWDGKYHPFYLQILLLIEIERKSNNQLATACGVSKQAMSKIILYLIEKRVILSTPSIDDGRSSDLVLTDKGRTILKETILRFNRLILEYQSVNIKNSIEKSEATLNIAKLFISKS